MTMIPCIVPCGRGRDINPPSHLPTPFQRAPGLQINARVDWRRVRRLQARPPHFLHHVETGVQADVAASFADIGRREAVVLQGGEGVLVKAAISARQHHVRKMREVKSVIEEWWGCTFASPIRRLRVTVRIGCGEGRAWSATGWNTPSKRGKRRS